MADLRAQILEIQNDKSLSESEKAIKRQRLLTQSFLKKQKESNGESKNSSSKCQTKEKGSPASDVDDLIGENLKCVICLNVCSKPVTAPCQHNFCLECLQRWLRQGKKNCVLCRAQFSRNFMTNPRINTTIVALIRAATRGSSGDSAAFANSEKARLAHNESRPAEAFTTERAQKTGLANAASGKLMVTCPQHHFGPIGPEFDPHRNRGLIVGDSWPNRLTCRQYGAHFPHVAGIAAQANSGAQSVVLSGGYIDDVDEGLWFLYTGSGGRDLSGNKRTSKQQDFDQTFEGSGNAGLLTSCKKGFPLRVVRSHKEKRSSYAPEATTDKEGNVVGCVRYDGIYRIEKCWRKPGVDGKLVCRYLIVRCDNEPAPFSSDDIGDRPGLTIDIKELGIKYTFGKGKKGTTGKVKKEIQDLYEREENVTPAWDWNAVEERWGWTCEPPRNDRKTVKPLTDRERLMKEFACDLSVKAKKKHVMKDPVTAPCGHKFCRACLSDAFKGVGDELDRKATSGRSLRKKKIVKCCPICKADITDTVNNLAVNHDLGTVIEKLKERCEYQSEEEDERPKEEKKAEASNHRQDANKVKEEKIEKLMQKFPGVDRGLIELLLNDQDGDFKDVQAMLAKMCKKQKTK